MKILRLTSAPDPASACLPARPLLLQVLVLVSPYSWLPAWTPKEKWVGGFREQASRRGGRWVQVALSGRWGPDTHPGGQPVLLR